MARLVKTRRLGEETRSNGAQVARTIKKIFAARPAYPEFVPLELATLKPDQPLACELYLRLGKRYVLYRGTSLPFTTADSDRLLSSGVDTLWLRISTEEDARSQHALRALLSLSDHEFPPRSKARVLYSSSVAIAKNTSSELLASDTLEAVKEMVNVIMAYLAGSPKSFQTLLSVMQHDYSTYAHAVNVAAYALGLAKFSGTADEEELRLLGTAAFLHDIGKINVPQNVLNKPGPLDADEWILMRQHPVWGREALASAADLPEIVRTVVYQHHERLDGSGYPDGLGGDDLQPYSRIVALVDSFDAMTSPRPYRASHSPFGALSVLKKESAGKLDHDLFTSLVLLLANPSQIASRQTLEEVISGNVPIGQADADGAEYEPEETVEQTEQVPSLVVKADSNSAT
jgi:putative nucleotidyltransferase with HDIG domain